MKTLLNKLIARQDLTETETFDAVSAILAGTMTPAQMGAFLAPGLLTGQQGAVLRLELLDALNQEFQLAREGLQFGVFHRLYQGCEWLHYKGCAAAVRWPACACRC